MADTGLSEQEAAARLKADGPNEVAEAPYSFWRAVATRLWEPSAWILEAALVVELLLGKTVQAGFIVLMLLFAAVNGAIQAGRAHRVLASLSQQLTLSATVMRDGKWGVRPARELVRGDLIRLRLGAIVPADAQLLAGGPIQLDESSITGESEAVTRGQHDPIFAGTAVLTGDCLATVTATGAQSRSGKTQTLLATASAPGHLQRLLGQVIKDLALVDSVLVVILLVAALVRGQNLISLLPFLAMLFIATIPIAMPSSFAVANSVEANVLSYQHILVSDLVGIQEAAAMDVLVVDKTGTLTANKTSVQQFLNLSARPDVQVRQAAALACDPIAPSPLEQAVRDFAGPLPQTATDFSAFDATRGYSQAITPLGVVRLGAFAKLSALAQNTFETPAAALKTGRSLAVMIDDELCGVFILADTLRPDSQAAVQALRTRGVQVIMLSGDHKATAQQIAGAVGLDGAVARFADLSDTADVTALAGIAEVRAEDKLTIVKRLQAAGHIVGMTGDGVNDAPALRQAEVGVAVANAVPIAKRAAKIVLLTPGLTPLTAILDSGHRVYQRMLTWTITKLSRTAELMILLTLGVLLFGRVPLALNAMVLVAILNDLVTLVLGTDRTTITYRPENWGQRRLLRTASVLGAGWTFLGLALLIGLHLAGMSAGGMSTLLFNYLIDSAMLTILITRTARPFWRSAPSRAVGAAISVNVILTVGLSLLGLGVTAVSWQAPGAVLALTVVAAVLLDGLYLLMNKRHQS
ncbi:HAD-IC family P-type ATPase [Lacticaseibacillus yichunensis]|uniref:HAD-IC family P-type ATPase n=1 Tax=Lacticaseibacillus yichunensis TaxID=2486015 RepID=A0ABW4CP98_9LACO|nr:HAD-IC family P-type ATPase [Lacticaseibacillus yichunensis]